jgi:hypothetical protein
MHAQQPLNYKGDVKWSNGLLAVGVDPATLSKNSLRLEVAVQPSGVGCGFHVVLNACSLTNH